MISLTVDELFKIHAKALALTWIGGRQGEHREMLLENNPKLANVGYLNLIHPHQIQIIGSYEITYLKALEPDIYQSYFKQLFENENLVCLILVDVSNVPEDFFKAAELYHIPLFSSKLSGENLINYMHTTIARLIAQRITLHGVFMDVFGTGVLITGNSGTGKSELALELIYRGHRLIADDAPIFSKIDPKSLSGTCLLDNMNAFLEVRGLGILNVQALFGDSAIKKDKYLRLIVHLEQMSDERLWEIDRLQGDYSNRSILDVDIPEISLPVAPGRNLAVLLECAVRNHSLKMQGYNAADDFCERQNQAIYSN
jgi:HPr kinase/phosphorylase